MSLPPYPNAPNLFQRLQWIRDPYAMLDRFHQRDGDTFVFPAFPAIFFSHPDAIQAIFTAPPGQFSSGSANSILLPVVGPNSLIVVDGETHKRQRRLLMPPFHGDRLRTYSELIGQITQQVASQWPLGQPFSLRPAVQAISLELILHIVFGLSEGDRPQQIKQVLREMLDAMGSPLSSSVLFLEFLQKDWGAWTPWGQFKRRMARIDALLYAEIRDRRDHADPNRTDILSLLLAARDEAGEAMSDEELRDELITLLLAGHETTASSIAWALYWIHRLPQVRDRLLAELDNGEPVSQLPYLDAVCQETLRLYPVAPVTFPRIVQQPCDIMGHRLEPGMLAVPCIYLAHRRPEVYANPMKFCPQRFLERQFSSYEFLPFGGGNRRCIGMAFALLEMKEVLAELLSRYRFTLPDGWPVRPTRRGVTVAPPNNLQVIAERRNEADSNRDRAPADLLRQ